MRKDIALGHQNKINGAWIVLALDRAFELYGMDYDCLITISKIILKNLREKHFLDFIDLENPLKNIPFRLATPTAYLRPIEFFNPSYYNREIMPITEKITQVFTPYTRYHINGFSGGDDGIIQGAIPNPQRYLCLAEILKWMGEVKHHNRMIKFGRGNFGGHMDSPFIYDNYKVFRRHSLSGQETSLSNQFMLSPLDMPETPRSSYLKEQYFRADGNVKELNKIYPHKSLDEIQKMIEDYNLKTGLWVLREKIIPLENGKTKTTHSFKKNQDNIKYYKDYLKIQLHLEISPSVDYKQKTRKKYNSGEYYFENKYKRGFCLGIWEVRGIGDREAFTTSALNYYGREGIFMKEGDNFMRVRDGQYIVKN